MIGQENPEPLNATCFSSTHQPSPQRRRRNKGNFLGGQNMAVSCPHCLDTARLRSSQQLTRLVKECRFICDGCEHGFVAIITIDRTTRPSERPDPRVNLRVTPPRNLIPANDDKPSASAGSGS
jgi:hypothetical protein